MSIFVKHSQPFTAVPNYLVNDPNVSAEALAVITYLAGKPTGWIARSYDIRKRFGWGDRKWRWVSKELRSLGLIHEVKHAEGTNLYFEIKWEKENVYKSLDNPVDKRCDPPVHFSTVLKPTRAKRTGIERKSSTKKDLLEKKIIRTNNNCLKIEQHRKEQERKQELDKQLLTLTNKLRRNSEDI